MDNHLLTAFIVLTAVAVLIQAGIMVALYLAVLKTTARMESMTLEMKNKAIPALETTHSMLVQLRPRIETMAVNLSESTTLVRSQIGRIDATLSDALDRTRLQVIRADELLNRTMDKVEETSEVVHKTVVSPLRQVSGLMSAISTGVEVFLGQKRRQPRNGMGVPQDEMFI
jgi:hypothetical protein